MKSILVYLDDKEFDLLKTKKDKLALDSWRHLIVKAVKELKE